MSTRTVSTMPTMNEVDEATRINQRAQEAKKLFGYVVSKNPETLYKEIGEPTTEGLPVAAHESLTTDYAIAFKEKSGAQDLLLFGIGDTQTFILNIMQHHPAITFERAVEIAQHERTTKALAVVARQSGMVSNIMINHPGDIYDLDPSGIAIDVATTVEPSYRSGCPAVNVIGRDVEPWPIFNRFAPWAAKLALISYYDHR